MPSLPTPIPALHTALARLFKATEAKDAEAMYVARAQVFGAALGHPRLLGDVRLVGASDCAMATVNTVGDAIVTVDSRGNLRLWDAADGALRERMEVSNAIHAVAFAGPLDKGILGTVGGHGEAVVILPSTGQHINLNAIIEEDILFEGVLPFGGAEPVLCFVGETSVLVALDDGALRIGGFDRAWVLAVGQDVVIRAEDDQLVLDVDDGSQTLTEGPGLEEIDDIAVAPNGAHIAFRAGHSIYVFARGEKGFESSVRLECGENERLWAMAFAADGDLVMLRARHHDPIASAWRWTPSQADAHRAWDIRTAEEGSEPALIALAMDASAAFVLDGSQNQALVIDVESGTVRSRIRGFEPHEVVGWTTVDVDPRAVLAAIHSVVGEEQHMCQLTELHAIESGAPLMLLADWNQIHPGSRVAFSTDGTRFAAPTHDGLHLYHLHTASDLDEESSVQETRHFHPYADFQPDAQVAPTMATGFDVQTRWLGVSFGGYLGELAYFGLYDLDGNTPLWSCALGHAKAQELFVLSGESAVVRTRDGIYWCVSHSSHGHRLDIGGNLRDALFTALPDGRLAAWWDGTLYLFEADADGTAPRVLGAIATSGHVERLVAADQGRFLVTIGVGQARVWRIVDDAPHLIQTIYGESTASYGSPWLLTRDGDGLAIRHLGHAEIHMFADAPAWMARRIVPEISGHGNAIIARAEAEIFVVDLLSGAVEMALASREESEEEREEA